MAISFTTAEARQIVRALGAVASADGAVLVREMAMLEGFAMQHGVSADVSVPLDEEALAHVVLDFEKRREVIRLCLRMALADHEYSAMEGDIIAKIAVALGVSLEEMALLTNAAKKP